MADKSTTEIIQTFHEQVNLTADELEKWLDNPNSRKAGTGVGHDSGRRIVQILRKNPGKEEAEYDEDDIAHMRKVVAYNSRHLAQEGHLKDTKTIEQLEKAKSTIRSAHNWGHDPVKVKKQEDSPGKASGAQKGKKQPGAKTGPKRKRDEEEEDEEEEDEDEGSVERTLREEDTASGKKATRHNKRTAAPKRRKATSKSVTPVETDAKQA